LSVSKQSDQQIYESERNEMFERLNILNNEKPEIYTGHIENVTITWTLDQAVYKLDGKKLINY
jgi:hypothetical protein